MSERPKLTLERAFRSSPEEVWELWTTRDGIESWWGPVGFSVAVRDLDLRPGGKLTYSMSAVGSDQIDYMKRSGMPITTENRITFTEVDPPRRLVYRELADFIPGVEPYEVETIVELQTTAGGVRMVLTFESMHDEQWTKMAVMGRESQLSRLEALLPSSW